MEEMACLWSCQETMDELKQRVLYSTVEVERLHEERRKNRDYVNQLLQLLKVARKERDEARDDLHKLLQLSKSNGSQSLVLRHTNRTSSGITESNSDSDGSSALASVLDRATEVIDGLAEGKELPRKGKLLQAVMEAGPLLQTLIVAGPLPRWRNPPQVKAFHIPPVCIRGLEVGSPPQPGFQFPLEKRQRLS